MITLPSMIRTEEVEGGLRYRLPLRRPGPVTWNAVFVLGVAAMLLAMVWSHAMTPLAISITVSVAPAAFAIALFLMGRGEIVLEQGVLMGVHRCGPFRRRDLVAADEVQRLRIMYHVPRAPGLAPPVDLSATEVRSVARVTWPATCDLVATSAGGATTLLLEAYPPAWVVLIAHDLRERLSSDRQVSAVSEDEIVVEDETGWSNNWAPLATDWGGLASAHELPRTGCTREMKQAAMYAFFMACLLAMPVVLILWAGWPRPWVFDVALALFAGLSVIALSGVITALRCGSEHTVLAIDRDVVRITRSNGFASRVRTLGRHEIVNVTVGASRIIVPINLAKGDYHHLPELHLHLANGRLIHALTGRNEELLNHIARDLRFAIGRGRAS